MLRPSGEMPNKQRGQAAATSRAAASPHTPLGHGPKSANLVVWPLAVFIFLQKRLLAFVKKGKKKIEEGRGPRDLRTCLNNGKAAAAGFVYVIKKGHSFEVTDEQPQRWPIKAAGL